MSRASMPMNFNPTLPQFPGLRSQDDLVRESSQVRRDRTSGLIEAVYTPEKLGNISAISTLEGEKLDQFLFQMFKMHRAPVKIGVYKWTPTKKSTFREIEIDSRYLNDRWLLAQWFRRKIEADETVAGIVVELSKEGIRKEAVAIIYEDAKPPKSEDRIPKIAITHRRLP